MYRIKLSFLEEEDEQQQEEEWRPREEGDLNKNKLVEDDDKE